MNMMIPETEFVTWEQSDEDRPGSRPKTVIRARKRTPSFPSTSRTLLLAGARGTIEMELSYDVLPQEDADFLLKLSLDNPREDMMRPTRAMFTAFDAYHRPYLTRYLFTQYLVDGDRVHDNFGAKWHSPYQMSSEASSDWYFSPRDPIPLVHDPDDCFALRGPLAGQYCVDGFSSYVGARLVAAFVSGGDEGFWAAMRDEYLAAAYPAR